MNMHMSGHNKSTGMLEMVHILTKEKQVYIDETGPHI